MFKITNGHFVCTEQYIYSYMKQTGDTEKATSYRDIVVKRSNPKSNKNDSMKNDWAENKNKDTP